MLPLFQNEILGKVLTESQFKNAAKQNFFKILCLFYWLQVLNQGLGRLMKVVINLMYISE